MFPAHYIYLQEALEYQAHLNLSRLEALQNYITSYHQKYNTHVEHYKKKNYNLLVSNQVHNILALKITNYTVHSEIKCPIFYTNK